MLQQEFKPVFLGIFNAFQSLGYKTHFKKLDSRDYGLPQDSRRLYIVGIRADVMKHALKWPVRQQPTPTVNVVLVTVFARISATYYVS
jgi:site-specific DNA-cytosine methylase